MKKFILKIKNKLLKYDYILIYIKQFIYDINLYKIKFIFSFLLILLLLIVYYFRYTLLIYNKSSQLITDIQEYNKNIVPASDQLFAYRVSYLSEKLIYDTSIHQDTISNINKNILKIIFGDRIAVVIIPNNCPSSALREVREFNNKVSAMKQNNIVNNQARRMFYISKNLQDNNYYQLIQYNTNDCKGFDIFEHNVKDNNNILPFKVDKKEEINLPLQQGYYLILKWKKDNKYYVINSPGNQTIDDFSKEYKANKRSFKIYNKKEFQNTNYYQYLQYDFINTNNNLKKDVLIKLDLEEDII